MPCVTCQHPSLQSSSLHCLQFVCQCSFFFPIFFFSRITDIYDKIPMTVAGVVGYLESASPYQVFLKNDPEAAKTLLPEMEKR